MKILRSFCRNPSTDFQNVGIFASYYGKYALKKWNNLELNDKKRMMIHSDWSHIARLIECSKMTIDDAILFMQDKLVPNQNSKNITENNNNSESLFRNNKIRYIICNNSNLFDVARLVKTFDSYLHIKEMRIFLWNNYFTTNDKIIFFEKKYDRRYDRGENVKNLLDAFGLDCNESWNFLKTCPQVINNIVNLSELQEYKTDDEIISTLYLQYIWTPEETHTLAKYLYRDKIKLVEEHIKLRSVTKSNIAKIVGEEFHTIKLDQGRHAIFAHFLHNSEVYSGEYHGICLTTARCIAWKAMPNEKYGPDFLCMLTCEGSISQKRNAVMRLFNDIDFQPMRLFNDIDFQPIKNIKSIVQLLHESNSSESSFDIFLQEQLDIANKNISGSYVSGDYFVKNFLIPIFPEFKMLNK